MLKCKQVIDLVSQNQDDPIPWLQQWQMKLHLLICERCRRYLQQLEFIGKATGQWVNYCRDKTLSDNARQRIMEKLKAIRK
jgi:hypothetical protein